MFCLIVRPEKWLVFVCFGEHRLDSSVLWDMSVVMVNVIFLFS